MSHRMLKQASYALFGLMAGFTGGAWATVRSKVNMPQGVTEISREVYDLHMLVLWICVVIGVIVFGAMLFSIIFHRKGKREAAHFHENLTLEIGWTVVPFILLFVMAVPAARTLIKMEDASNSEITIQVTGYQWRWHYNYIDEGFGYFSNISQSSNEARQLGAGIDLTQVEHYLLDVDNPMVVPVDTKIRILLTSNDVNHAWWMPELAIKKDALPGYINEVWTQIDTPGTYRGQCAELCGRDHAFMPVVVVAMEQDDYDQWLAERQAEQAAEAEALTSDRDWELAELMERGQGVYMSQCAACHQPNGQGLPAAGFPPLVGDSMAADPARLAEHIDMVLHGSRRNPAMAAFGRTLNDLDIAAVVTYERNAFGNETGDVVQPRDIGAARGQ